MKFLKKLLLFVPVLLLVLWFGANAALYFGKARLESYVSKQLNEDVSVESAWLNLIPSLGVTISKLAIGSKDLEKTHTSAGKITAKLPYTSLLRGSYAPSSFSVSDLVIKTPAAKVQDALIDVRELDLSKEESRSAKIDVRLQAVVIVDGVDHYNLDMASGPIDFVAAKDSPSFRANLDVKNFAYSDGETTISKTNAALKNIKGSLPPSGDVTVTVDLDANTFKLENPSIHIHSVKRVISPVVVKIPAAGGYEVTGPVTIKDAKFKTIMREFTEVNSTIDMLVSSPLKEFVTESIAFVTFDKPAVLSTKFSMTRDAYIIGDTKLERDGGVITAATTMQRGEKKDFDGYLKIKTLDLSDTLKALKPGSEKHYGGKIYLLDTKFNGDAGDLKKTLKAHGDLAIGKLTVGGKNVREEILAVAKENPVLAPAKLTEDGEEPPQLSGTFEVADGTVRLDKLHAPFKRFNLEANGDVTLEKEVDMRVDVVFLEENAGALGLGVGPLKTLFGDIGKITIPFKAKGILPDVTFGSDKVEWAKRLTGISLVETVVDTAVDVGESIGDSLSPDEEVETTG